MYVEQGCFYIRGIVAPDWQHRKTHEENPWPGMCPDTSQAMGFPLAQGRRVVPSGRLLSSRVRLTGSLTAA